MATEQEIQAAQEAGTVLPTDDQGRQRGPKSKNPLGGVVSRVWERWPLIDNTVYTPTAIHQALKVSEYGDFGRQLDMFQRMVETDAHLAAVVQTRRLTAKKAESHLAPPEGLEDDLKAQAAVEYLGAVLTGLKGYKDLTERMINGPIFGFFGNEIEWRGTIPVALHETPNDGWRWHDGGLQYRNEAGEWLPVPMDKFIIHSPASNSPRLTRRGVMRTVCYPWVLKHYSTRDWASFVEVFGMPGRFAKVPSEWDANDPRITDIFEALKSMSSDGVGVFSEDVDIDAFAHTVGAAGSPHESFVRWCDQQFSKAVLSQTLTTDTSGQTGTYAATRVHNEVRLDVAQADIDGICETKRRDLFTPIIGYGLGWDFPVPVIRSEVENTEEQKAAAEKLDVAVNKLGLDVPVSEAYGALSIRPPVEDEPILPGQRQTSTSLPPAFTSRRSGHTCGGISMGMAGDGADETQIALTALAKLSAEDWNDVNGQFVMNDVAVMVRENPALTVSEAIDRLTTFYPTLPVEDLQASIEEALTAAAVNGLLEVDEEADNPDADRKEGIERKESGEGPER